MAHNINSHTSASVHLSSRLPYRCEHRSLGWKSCRQYEEDEHLRGKRSPPDFYPVLAYSACSIGNYPCISSHLVFHVYRVAIQRSEITIEQQYGFLLMGNTGKTREGRSAECVERQSTIWSRPPSESFIPRPTKMTSVQCMWLRGVEA